jgi:hypothetical protein
VNLLIHKGLISRLEPCSSLVATAVYMLSVTP